MSDTPAPPPEPSAPTEGTAKRKRGCLNLVGAGLVVIGLVGSGLFAMKWSSDQKALETQEAAAEAAFAPARDKLAEGISAEVGEGMPAYDIDKTIRVIHEIDQAVANSDNLEDWLAQMSKQDYRGVAPEVLEARQELLNVLMKVYARQVALEDQEALWNFSSGLVVLSAMSMVEIEGELDMVSPNGSLSVDQEKAEELLDRLLASQEEQAQLQRELRLVEAELTRAMVGYSSVYYKYVEEWDRVSLARERAYLASWNGQWDMALESADEAIRLAPLEREAHLLKAMALIEQGGESDREAEQILGKYLDDHPGQSAPALLLMGVLNARNGDRERAQLSFQQAALNYPKQAASLTDLLDPYRSRVWLRHSAQGSHMLELYQSTMLGAGYFSPDLQLARMAFEDGDFEGGRDKVLDHFRRRSNQGQWDFILSDLEFCHTLLGDDYRRIFPEDAWLDLVVTEAMLSDKLNVKVNNRSDMALHNATLVVALYLTDMFQGDYQTVSAERTQPVVSPRKVTDFGTVEIVFDRFFTEKGPDDIIDARAILVTDEAVVWVDTQEFKAESLQALTLQARTNAPKPEVEDPIQTWTRSMSDRVLEQTRGDSTLSFSDDLFSDDLTFQLPRELSLLRPLFRLRHGGTLHEAEENFLVGDHIELTFSDVGNLNVKEGATDIELLGRTPIGDVVMTWRMSPDGSTRLVDVGLDGFTAEFEAAE
ncbi:MAG: tetratricopeptide (TPR) repeat protein [Myxococcota bacterium]|jgi:tetratricopeptide (TPR) repeat protein